jgi:hypothetical protein
LKVLLIVTGDQGRKLNLQFTEWGVLFLLQFIDVAILKLRKQITTAEDVRHLVFGAFPSADNFDSY